MGQILGKALKDLPRSDIILATKVGRYHYEEFDFSTDNIIKSVNTSLERLQTDYIDLVQCHDIEFVNIQQALSIRFSFHEERLGGRRNSPSFAKTKGIWKSQANRHHGVPIENLYDRFGPSTARNRRHHSFLLSQYAFR